MIAYTAVFIGHRNYDFSLEAELEETVLALIRNGYSRFLSGGMGNFDRACEDCVLRLKLRYPHIRLCLVQTGPSAHPTSSRYDEIIYPNTLKDGITSVSIPIRNKLMVQSASAAVCHLERTSGGAYASLRVAMHEALMIYHV